MQPTTATDLRAKNPGLPVDPDAKIPKSVRDAGVRAEAIQRAINGEAEPSVLAEPDPNATVQVAPQPDPKNSMTVQAAPPVAPQPQAPHQEQQPQPQEQAPPTPQDWERSFYGIKGRYDKQQQDMAAMAASIERLENALAAAQQAPPPPPPEQRAPARQLLTEQEVQDYGPEFIDVVRRAATEVAAPLHEEIQNLRGQLGSVQQETGNSFLTRMNATIGGLVPNWDALNRDPGFVQWTSLPDVFSNVRRSELMQEAWNSGDAHRVATFFRAYLAEEAAVDPQASAQRGRAGFPPSLAPPAPSPPQLSLESLAAPGRAHAVAQMPAAKPVYTAQDISRFYTEVAGGKWRGRDQERAAIDADIMAAQRDGRIIPDQRTARPMDNLNGGR